MRYRLAKGWCSTLAKRAMPHPLSRKCRRPCFAIFQSLLHIHIHIHIPHLCFRHLRHWKHHWEHHLFQMYCSPEMRSGDMYVVEPCRVRVRVRACVRASVCMCEEGGVGWGTG